MTPEPGGFLRYPDGSWELVTGYKRGPRGPLQAWIFTARAMYRWPLEPMRNPWDGEGTDAVYVPPPAPVTPT